MAEFLFGFTAVSNALGIDIGRQRDFEKPTWYSAKLDVLVSEKETFILSLPEAAAEEVFSNLPFRLGKICRPKTNGASWRLRTIPAGRVACRPGIGTSRMILGTMT